MAMGTGMIETRRAMQIFAATGYAGDWSGEWMQWEPVEVHLPREIETVRGYE